MTRFPDFFEQFARNSDADVPMPPPEFDGWHWRMGSVAPTADRPPQPPTWTTNHPEDLEAETPTYDITLPDRRPNDWSAEGTLPEPIDDLLPSGGGVFDIDVIAVYRPWHLWRDQWGIYISARGFATYAELIARYVGSDRDRLAPIALRQLLRHEQTHFEFEVAATELEDALGRPLYSSYLREHFRDQNQFSVRPLEEAVATFREFQAGTAGRLPLWIFRPENYSDGLRAALKQSSPPGYRSFEICENRQVEKVTAEVCALIAQKSIATGRWGATAVNERDMVPVRWIGDESAARAAGAEILAKSVGPQPLRQFEKWIRKCCNGRIDKAKGKGDHRQAILVPPSGPEIEQGYDKIPVFEGPPLKALKQKLDLPTIQSLRLLIRDLKSPFA